jgi:uncharacterized protein YgiM (DUF1202 family)
MKLNILLIALLAPLTSVMVLAQDTAAPAATDAAPAAPKKKASPVRKKVVLDPPVSATIKISNVNVRGRPSFTGETIGHVQKGDTVSVLEQITLSRTTKDEPAEWAEIALPTGIPVWVDGEYIDSEANTIKARRVNLRGGPGENFSVLGRLEKGATVKVIKKERGWAAIEAPTNAYAFVAAEFLEMLPPAAVVVTAPPPVPAADAQPVSPATPAPADAAAPTAPAPAPQRSETAVELEALHRATAGDAAPTTTTPEAAATATDTNEPPKPRVVTREGFVRRAYNIQAPADFELHDIQSGTILDYLQPKPGQNFKIFLGTRVTVTGPEGIAARWTRTPVLQVQSVDLMP